MAVINLRSIDEQLVTKLKQEAVSMGIGFHRYCALLLEHRGRVNLNNNIPFPGIGPALPSDITTVKLRSAGAAVTVYPASTVTIPVSTASRLAHSIDCKCGMCRP